MSGTSDGRASRRSLSLLSFRPALTSMRLSAGLPMAWAKEARSSSTVPVAATSTCTVPPMCFALTWRRLARAWASSGRGSGKESSIRRLPGGLGSWAA
eukprot:scaffold301185_cov33-Tisochrysis_lutea.AAC.3